MAGPKSYSCPDCYLAFPKESDYNKCPLCGVNTTSNYAKDPMPRREAEHCLKVKAFGEWCKENNRDGEEPLSGRLKLPMKHTITDGMVAMWMFEKLYGGGIAKGADSADLYDSGGQMPNLVVTLTGLVRG